MAGSSTTPTIERRFEPDVEQCARVLMILLGDYVRQQAEREADATPTPADATAPLTPTADQEPTTHVA